jgi:DNA invertase Pin-like site-specific DNA recombinase
MRDMPIPAAQYLRMSTEHQQYSIHNQAHVIGLYAAQHGFEVINSYIDAGKSGLALKHRKALGQLLNDVVAAPQVYRAILVYDVSRWGRFQDIDEAAYYEFMCKRAGFAVHYCAEMFANDVAAPSLIMKTLKRVMAAEYSRELSSRTFERSRRNAERGFRNGGMAGYGLRRLICSPDGTPKQLLELGDRKAIYADRVRLIPGPAEEVAVVREIFRMITERMTLHEIANELNTRQIKYFDRSWTNDAVNEIVTNPKYMGWLVWGTCAKKLGEKKVRQPEASWVKVPSAFESLVDERTFFAAQAVFRRYQSDEQMLSGLRRLLVKEGCLNRGLIENCRDIPCSQMYKKRFGGLMNAYTRIGYIRPKSFRRKDLVQRIWALRKKVVGEIATLFPRTALLHRSSRHWPKLRLPGGPIVGVIVCQATTTPVGHPRWVLPCRTKQTLMSLVCRCNAANATIRDYHLIPRIEVGGRQTLKECDPVLLAGKRVVNLRNLLQIAKAMAAG